MANPNIWAATLTLMDGTTIKIPTLQISSYSSQYTYPTYGAPAVFQQSIVMLSDSRELAVQENAAGIALAIKNATDVSV
jgi:hypothetical protein